MAGDIEFIKNGVEIGRGEKFDPGRLRVVFFSGYTTNTPEKAREITDETTHKLLDEAKIDRQDIDIYAAYFNVELAGVTRRYNEGLDTPEDRARIDEMTERVFGGLIQKEGKRLKTQEAAGNFEKLVLQGQCLGGYIIDAMRDNLYDRMVRLGYDRDEISRLIPKVRALITNSGAEYKFGEPTFDTYRYGNLSDEVAAPMGKAIEQMKAYSGLDKNDEEPQIKMVRISPTQRLMAINKFDLPTDEEVMQDAKETLKEGKNLNEWYEKKRELTRRQHYAPCTFSPANLGTSAFSRRLKETLFNFFTEPLKQAHEQVKQKEAAKLAMREKMSGNGMGE